MAWGGHRTPQPQSFPRQRGKSLSQLSILRMGDNLQQMRAGRETEARHNEALQLAGGGAGATVVFCASPSP